MTEHDAVRTSWFAGKAIAAFAMALAFAMAIACATVAPDAAYASVKRGTMEISTVGEVTLDCGTSASVECLVAPASRRQGACCSTDYCLSGCDVGLGCLDADGFCTCLGGGYFTTYATCAVTSSAPNVARASWSGGVLTVKGYHEGTATISVTAKMSLWVSSTATISVVVGPPAGSTGDGTNAEDGSGTGTDEQAGTSADGTGEGMNTEDGSSAGVDEQAGASTGDGVASGSESAGQSSSGSTSQASSGTKGSSKSSSSKTSPSSNKSASSKPSTTPGERASSKPSTTLEKGASSQPSTTLEESASSQPSTSPEESSSKSTPTSSSVKVTKAASGGTSGSASVVSVGASTNATSQDVAVEAVEQETEGDEAEEAEGADGAEQANETKTDAADFKLENQDAAAMAVAPASSGSSSSTSPLGGTAIGAMIALAAAGSTMRYRKSVRERVALYDDDDDYDDE